MGYRYLNTGTAVPVFAAEPPVATEGSLYYNSTSEVFYICNGTQWNLVSNANPATTGGTVTIDALSEGGTFSYDLGDDFTDDVDTDGELTYTKVSGTLPSGCTLPTTGNSAFTGTASGVSSNTNYTWTIKATDTSGGTATQDYQQTINTVAPTSTGGTVTISAVDEGSSASYDVGTNFTFGTGSTFSAYSLQSGSLPSGLSLNTSSGVISGTMGEVSSTTAYSFTIRGTDTDGDTADQAYSWTITDVPPVAEFLVIAGGGGNAVNMGGNREAGSGAGGLRTSYGSTSGGGGGAEGDLTLTAGAVYTATVGAGGSGHTSGATSSFSGSGVSTITSTGGGSGGHADNATHAVGHNGGSGGGGWYNNGTAGQGISGQGYAGSPGFPASEYGGAGGGAGGVGGRGPVKGLGLAVSITGGSITYATGGAASDYPSTNRSANGGANTGNGASGAANGGSGLVVIRILSTKYSGTTTGSPTVTTDGSYKVIKFTGDGSYTA